MEQVDDDLLQLLPPASLFWLEDEVLDLDLFTTTLEEASEISGVRAVQERPADSQAKTDEATSSGNLSVVVRLNKPQHQLHDNTQSKARASHRQRQKQDIQILRAHVADLQHELRFLQAGASVKGVTNAASAVALRSTSILMTNGASSWQSVARQQFQARELAEEENRMLLQTLRERIRMAKSLERMLLQHEMIRSNPRPYHAIRTYHDRIAKPGPWDSSWVAVTSFLESDLSVFHELLARVDESANDLDAVFRSNGLDRVTTELLDARLEILPTIGLPAMAIEMMDVKILPFNLEETVSAAWRCLTSKRASACTPLKQWQHQSGLAGRTDVVVMRLEEHDHLWRRTMKKIIDSDHNCTAFVWETQMLTKESGMLMRQRGWLQFETLPAPSGSPKTIARSCRYGEPQLESIDAEAATDSQQLKAREYFSRVADNILQNYRKAVRLTYEAVEKILVEECRNCVETTV